MTALIKKHFPNLSPNQVKQFEQLLPLYTEWNAKINVVSRKDIEHLYLHHVLHSLSIAKVIQFKAGTKVLDIGTGGGFPGIPLAILFPEAQFHLVDSIKKKIRVVEEIITTLELKNATAEWKRAEEVSGQYHFVVSRAVSYLKTLYTWSQNKISKQQFNDFKNGLLALKGGDLADELDAVDAKPELFPINNFFEEDYFKEKWVVYVNATSRK